MISNKIKYINRSIALTIIVLSAFVNSGCFTVKYDFKGGIKIDPRVKTFSVQYFDNRAPRIEPTLSQRMTTALKDYIESNTNLKLVTTYGDADFTGVITNYSIQAAAITAGDVAAQTRFTIAVKVTYSNIYDEEGSYEETFTKSLDFDSSTDISAVESEYSDDMIDEIVELIFNKAFINW